MPNSASLEPVAPLGDGLDASALHGASLARLRLDLAYDGTDFAGWARQSGLRTVQGEVERGLATVLRLREPAALTVAGRTDAGVHARGQVAHVDVPMRAWEPLSESLVRRLAGVLPHDVRVFAVAPAPAGFDARFGALSRRYAYRLATAEGGPDPLRRHEQVWYARPLDVAAMNAAAAALIGEHDFAAFCRRREGASTVRALLRLSWRSEGDVLVEDVEADAFCHSMVRALTGALIAVGEGRRAVGWPAEVLGGRVRDSGVQVMPAHGLTLEQVRYPSAAGLIARADATRRHRAPLPAVKAPGP